MLEIKNLTFKFSDIHLLKDLELTVKKGSITSIIGPSGSGKTTLFKLISGLIPLQEGVIQVLGESDPKRRRALISYMMQEDLLLPWKTLMENLLFVFELENPSFWKGIKEKYTENYRLFKERVKQIIEDVGLQGFENYYPSQLSGGMRQRTSLARSLLFNKPLILLDEPFGAIDVFKRKGLYSLISEIKEKYQLTIVFITHDLNDAMQLSDDIYFLDNGLLKMQQRTYAL